MDMKILFIMILPIIIIQFTLLIVAIINWSHKKTTKSMNKSIWLIIIILVNIIGPIIYLIMEGDKNESDWS